MRKGNKIIHNQVWSFLKQKYDLNLIPGLEALNKERNNVLRLFDEL